jgi:hypothetical protein
MGYWETSGKSNDWYTPKFIFDALGCQFDLDVANGAIGGAHVPCIESYGTESLDRAWHGFVWMNPPFEGRNGLEPWLNKFVNHGNGIALTPDRTSAPWFQQSAGQMDLLLFMPKVKFERPDGTRGRSPSNGTVLMAMGQQGIDALWRAKHLGWLAMPAITRSNP